MTLLSPTYDRLIILAAIAFGVCLVMTPIIRRLAFRFDIIDRPDGHRKLHVGTTALGGGVAVLSAVLTSMVVAIAAFPSVLEAALDDAMFYFGFGVSCLLICGVGLVDDRYGLRGRQKLVAQIVICLVLMSFGLVIREVQVFHWRVPLHHLAIPFTLFWLLGSINALNLIDGIDGLASSVGLVVSIAIAVLGVMGHHYTDALIAAAIAGSLAAFLVYNAPPANIFLGDAGSMLIGLILGTLAIRCSLKGPASIALAAPMAIWAIPIFDVCMAIVRRKLTGRSIYTTDRGHLHHTLQRTLERKGYGSRFVVIVVGLLCCATATTAVFSVYIHSELLAVAGVTVVLSALVLTGVFGHQEFGLAFRRAGSIMPSLIPTFRDRIAVPRESQTRLQGDRDWQILWQTLIEFAKRFNLTDVQLNVQLPAIDEEFHAQWRHPDNVEESEAWTSDLPLIVNTARVGRLSIRGRSAPENVCEELSDVFSGLKAVEKDISVILQDHIEALNRDSETAPDLQTLDEPMSIGVANKMPVEL